MIIAGSMSVSHFDEMSPSVRCRSKASSFPDEPCFGPDEPCFGPSSDAFATSVSSRLMLDCHLSL